jgi:hypothetical protein
MKNITKPAQREESDYYSDFSGKKIKFPVPPAQITLDFNYGSPYDESKITFDLDNEEAKEVIAFFREKLSARTRKELNRRLKLADKNHDDNFQARDWHSVEHYGAEAQLLEALLGVKKKY